MPLQDSDNFIVGRGSNTYKISYDKLKEELGTGGGSTAPVVDSVTLSQDGATDGNRFTSKSFTTNVVNSGGSASRLEMTGRVTGALNIKAGTEPISGNLYSGTNSTNVLLFLEGATNLGDVSGIEVGDTVTASSSYTPKTSKIEDFFYKPLALTAGVSSTVDFSGLDDDDNIFFFVIENGSNGANGAATPDATSQPNRGGNGGGRGGSYYRQMTKAEYVAEFGTTTYTQALSNNFGGTTLLGSNAAGGNGGSSGSAGTNGNPFSTDFTTINSFYPGELVFAAGSAGGSGSFKPSIGLPDPAPGGGGDAGILITTTFGSLPNLQQATSGGSADYAGGISTANGGSGGSGYGAGGGGGAAAPNQSRAGGQFGSGINIVVTGVSQNATLTLEDSTDIHLFQTGDEVQPGVSVVSTDVAQRKIVVDGGDWSVTDSSQPWSSNVTGDVRTDRPPADAFDGDESTYANAATPPGDGGTSITFNFDPGLPSGQTQFLADASINYTPYTKLEINGVDRTDAVFGSLGSDTDLPKQYWTLSTADGSDIDSVTIYSGRDNNVFDGISVYGFKSEGSILVDEGIGSALGDSEVSTTSPKQGKGTVLAINGSQVTISPFTDNCFKTGQWLTVDKLVEITPVSDRIADYSKESKTLTFDSAKDLVQFTSGDAVYMSDSEGVLATPTFTTSAVTAVEPGSGQVTFCSTNGQTVDFSSLSDDTIIGILLVTSGEKGTVGKQDDFGGGNDRSGGNGGKGGRVYTRIIDVATYKNEFGDSFTYIDNTNNFGGTLDVDNPNGGTGGFASDSSVNNGTPGQKMSPDSALNDFRSLMDGYVTFNFGEPGAGGSWGGSGANKGGGGGGGGGGLVIVGDGIPASPTAELGTEGNAGRNGPGGEGWGGGSGGGGGGTTLGSIGTPGNPAPGAAVVFAYRPTTLTFADATDLDKFKDGDSVLSQDGTSSTVVGNPTINPSSMDVADGDWKVGDTVSVTKSGTGTVDSVDLNNKTIVMSVSNDQWIDDYFLSTAAKPAVAITAYLRFNSAGAITGYQPTPVSPVEMDNWEDPTLTFPAIFSDTGQAPDSEFTDSDAFIQTSVQLKNDSGISEVKDSNILVPTSTFSTVVGPGETSNNVEEITIMANQVLSHDQRSAEYAVEQIQELDTNFNLALVRYFQENS